MITDDDWNRSPSPPPCEEWVIVDTPPVSFPDALGRYTTHNTSTNRFVVVVVVVVIIIN